MKMQIEVVTLDGAEDAGKVVLPADVFGLAPRADILHRMVRWQRNKAMQGTHKAKTRSEGNYSGRKIYKQKGGGRARHGDRNAPIFRKGGAYKGPVPRSHAHKLTKKFRSLGLRHALSAKAQSGDVVVLSEAVIESGKTSELVTKMKQMNWGRALIIDGKEIDTAFAKASANIPGLDILPCEGANVYDILKRDKLVITKAGLAALKLRLKL